MRTRTEEFPMTVNVELLERVMRHIEDHPEQHRQSAWLTKTDCGTVACFAGWSVLLSDQWETTHYAGHEFAIRAGGVDLHGRTAAPDIYPISTAAEEALGLEGDEPDILFYAGNTPDMLRRMVKDLVNGDELRDRAQYRIEAQDGVS